METLVNGLIGVVILVYNLIRGLLEWGDNALLTAAGAGVGAYFGVRAAHARHADTAGLRG